MIGDLSMKKYSVEEVFDLLGHDNLMISTIEGRSKRNSNMEIDGFQVYAQSLRYATFFQKGTKCVCCGKEGTHFLLDIDGSTHESNRRHFNLYADDGTLVTKDHILPKKWGGKDTVDNLQTMCTVCNKNKGSNCNLEIEGVIAIRVDNPEKERHYIDMNAAIFDVCNNIAHILSKENKPGVLASKVINVATKLYTVIDSDTPAYGFHWRHGKFKVE